MPCASFRQCLYPQLFTEGDLTLKATKVDGVADQVLDKVKAAFKGNLVKGGGTSADVEISEVESPVSHRRRRRRRSKTTSARGDEHNMGKKLSFGFGTQRGTCVSQQRLSVGWRHEQCPCQRDVAPRAALVSTLGGAAMTSV